ncbi:erythrocyte membrane protein 1, PfEMP1, putative [Plasmodium reichenowi]|uniref:Erythrocyte membrane protein 1, PfEMP1, putative n=1 Tax=Plasmodium reichenowi TaxID=5854 RepID=A0A2P9D9Y7_PLARE|nr:erythrocyte membrane protein 1, PfEMP1, putative [Plasmodium reichenowi]
MGGGNGGGTQDAKHVLDEIGQKVHDEVKDAAKEYTTDLKGDLSFASFFDTETRDSADTCKLVNKCISNGGASDEKHGCGNEKERDKRFSKERGAECDEKKIEGSNGGACAPYRRLTLCNRNFQNINNNDSSKAKNDLLLDVCLAAQFEAESLEKYREQYDATYEGSGFTTCTALARSFADIADIIRGKDIYGGNRRERERRNKVQGRLEKIFGNIYDELKKEKSRDVEKRYKNNDPHFYKLREDWWTANRETVWEAITCGAGSSAYFRASCEGPSQAQNQCRCKKKKGTNVVPTYFDYVPQYLRWFEEWAEDFCRKKNKKLKDVKRNCRGEYEGEERYCSLNGCDCKKTIRARGKLRYGNRCIECLYECTPYVHWIDNQKEQFEKQKNKYEEEINRVSGSRRLRRGARNENYDGYEKKFYEELKTRGYTTVDAFLDSLSKESDCEKVKNNEGGTINFKKHNDDNNDNKGTFYHSEYCQPCPYCGMRRVKNSKKWENKRENDLCKRGNLYESNADAKPTHIEILKIGEKQGEITEKLNDFCKENKDASLYEQWECYEGEDVHVVKDEGDSDEDEEDEEDYQNILHAGGLCILENKNKGEKGKNAENEPDQLQKTFNDFFTYWVAHMLKDSVHWRTERLKKCLENDKRKCGNRNCSSNCNCFKEWIEQKRKEWENVRKHFYKQKDIEKGQHDITLKGVLQIQFSKDDTENSVSAREIDLINQMLQEDEKAAPVDTDKGNNNPIEKLLKHEEKKAEECIEKNPKECPPPRDPNPTRSENFGETTPSPVEEVEEEEFEEEEEKEEESDDDSSKDHDEGDAVEEVTITQQEDNKLNVCKIVKELFEKTEDNALKEACNLKYVTGKNYGWRCVNPTKEGSKGDKGNDGGDESDRSPRNRRGAEPTTSSSDSNSGAICVPPRRRKLYIGPLSKWAESQNKGGNKEGSKTVDGSEGKGGSDGASEAGNSQETVTSVGEASSPNPTSGSENPLLEAFIQSAAIETFFLWHQYKQLNKTPQDETTIALGNHTSYDTNADNGPFFASTGAGMRTQTPSKDQLTSLQAQGQGGLQLYKPASLPTGPHPPSPFIPPGRSSIFGNSSGQDEEERTGELDNQLSNGGLTPLSPPTSDTSDDPQATLTRGTIPAPFLRQMFYTLADYKDILFSGSEGTTSDNKDTSSSNDNLKNIVLEAGGNKEEMEAMQKIQEKLKKFFEENGGDKPSSSDTSRSPSGKQSPSDTPSSWWETTLGPAVWKAMICALTYTESDKKASDGTTTLQRDEAVYKKFFGDTPGNKVNTPDGTNTGTFKQKYEYNQVVLKDENSDGEKKNNVDPINAPTLKEFVSRPAYFRWLEEWGETFCRERAKRLAQIENDCKVDIRTIRGATQKTHKYSGDGEECSNIDINEDKIFADLENASCAHSCRFYKKWIERKKKEYEKQRDRYQTESVSAKSNDHGNGFSTILGKCTEAKNFLVRLGPCKTNDNGGSNIPFDDEAKTFGPAEDCKPCSEFKINCRHGSCSGLVNGTECPNYKITADDIKNKTQSTKPLDMLVSDNNPSGFKSDLKDCEHAGIFEGITKEQWLCGKVCGLDVCKPEKGNMEKEGTYIIQIRALVKRWVQNFVEDYNKIKHKISHCMNNGPEPNCIKHCEDKCKCADKWLEMKKEEWNDIKKHYLDKNQHPDCELKNLVKNFLQKLYPPTVLNKAIKPCTNLDDFEKSCGLNGTENSPNGKDDTPKDLVECLLQKLEEKAKKCQQDHKPNGTDCSPSTTPQNLEDDEDLSLEDQKVGHPQICGDMKTEEEKEEGECKPAKTPIVPKDDSVTEEEEKPKGDQTGDPVVPGPASTTTSDNSESEANPEVKPPVLKPETPPAVPNPAPKPKTRTKKRQQPIKPPPHISQPLFDAMLYNTLAWCIGIGITGLSYWFIKKKTRRPVDMFSVLEIPQNDYGIPTLKSSNRYIPYSSGKYRGKRYIYLEGDSGTDSGYTDHYSDITSSSESEYEEFDINDIYAPGSPKYKTLIEVVLEPSKRDTQNDIPSDNTPTNKLTDNEWNTLKDQFISNILQNEQNTEPNILHDNVDNNIHPTMPRDNVDQKPFIMSIHDRNLLSGQEYSYDMFNIGNNDLYSDIDPTSDKNAPYSDKNNSYSGIDLINDSLNSGNEPIDIYDEILKRKENELFGTKHHPKRTNTYSVAKNTNSDPITNQLELFHKWLDRHRDMCEKWDKNNKVDILNQLKEKWDNETHNGNKHSDTPSDNNIHSDIHPSNIPSGKLSDIPSSNKMLNSDVSIQIHLDNPKTTNEFTYVDSNPQQIYYGYYNG